MSDVSVKCVVCGEGTFERIIKFTPETLKKCMTVLEYRRAKPVRRKSRSGYTTVEISGESSLNDGYHAHCYKLFTAIKVPSDFRGQHEITPKSAQKSAQECADAQALADESRELLSIPGTSSTIDEASLSNKLEPDCEDDPLEDCEDPFYADELVRIIPNNEDLPHEECFICNKSRKRRRGRHVPLAVSKYRTVELLKSAATVRNDIEMLEKISTFSDSSNIPYHKCCKDLYLREIKKKEESDLFKKRKVLGTAYEILCGIVEESVVKKNECLFFDNVKKEYHRLLVEQYKLLSEPLNSPDSFSDRHLENKLMVTFAKKIKFIYVEKKKFLAPFSSNCVAYGDLFKTMSLKEKIRSVAVKLREEILNSTATKLSEDCTAEDLIKGECDNVPELLTCFLETFVLGDDSRLSKKRREIRKNNKDLTIFSIGQDMIYAASSHNIKTSKHISLGLAVKSLRNIKTIINLLSKYGHCCSYTTLEKLETELTYSTHLCPEDISRRPDLNTAVVLTTSESEPRDDVEIDRIKNVSSNDEDNEART